MMQGIVRGMNALATVGIKPQLGGMAIAAPAKVAAGDPNEPAKDASKLKQDWNQYIQWLDKKGMKGSPELDKGVGKDNLGMKYIELYRQENPTTSITPEKVADVQAQFKNYRDYAIDQIKNKKATYSGDVSKIDAPDSPFMKDLSIVDGIPGQRTTSWMFPNEFLTTTYRGPNGVIEKKTKQDLGLAKQ